MIFVKVDTDLIPEGKRKVLERAAAKVEALPTREARVEYIKSKSVLWRALGRYLREMSFGKCWYSESKNVMAFNDVDHFRPKSEAERFDGSIDEGYPWLAFDISNYRFSSNKCNRRNKNEETGETVGKGSYFPLEEGGKLAAWGDRCVDDEFPLLLDPTKKEDVRLLDVQDDGLISINETYSTPLSDLRVRLSINTYGLNLPELVEARRQAIRNFNRAYEAWQDNLVAANGNPNPMQIRIGDKRINDLEDLTRASQEYALAVRCTATRKGLSNIICKNEQV